MKRLALIIAALFALCACRKEVPDEKFILDDEVKLMMDDVTLLSYAPATCQIAYNSDNNFFVICTDNLSDYVTIELSETPREEGQTVYGNILWATDAHGIDARRNVALQVVKIQGDKVWLWNSNGGIKAVIRLLV